MFNILINIVKFKLAIIIWGTEIVICCKLLINIVHKKFKMVATKWWILDVICENCRCRFHIGKFKMATKKWRTLLVISGSIRLIRVFLSCELSIRIIFKKFKIAASKWWLLNLICGQVRLKITVELSKFENCRYIFKTGKFKMSITEWHYLSFVIQIDRKLVFGNILNCKNYE